MSSPGPHSGEIHAFKGLPQEWSVRRIDRSRRGADGQGIFVVTTAEQRFVLKVFGPKCGPLRQQLNRLDHLISGRSAPDPVSRYRTEKRALEIWRQNGFDVFCRLDHTDQIDIPFPYLALEHVSGPTLKNYFRDSDVHSETKKRVLKRFIPAWGRRHLLASRQANRFLIQEHASFKHVLHGDDGRLITFDFEEIFTERCPLAFLIGREIAGYLRSLFRVATPADFDAYLDIIVRHYTPAEFLAYPYRYFFRHPNPLLRGAYAVMRRFPANRRDNSRYSVIQQLQNRLERKI